VRKSVKSHEVVVKDDQRKVRVGVLVEALGHQHDGAQEHGPAPELRQQRALYADVANVLGVGLAGMGGITSVSEIA
jgi:tartrate dehydratase alpha subunit/fumarate hydratase class I-like protein